MNVLVSKVSLSAIKLYGFHGVSKEEQQVGSWFEIDIEMDVRVSIDALNHDNLRGTVDYSSVYEVIKKEFSTPCCLLEHLAHRTAQSLFNYFPRINKINLHIHKLTPPMGGNIRSASVNFVFEN